MDAASIKKIIIQVAQEFSAQLTQNWLLVSVENQTLYFISQCEIESSYLVSTSKFGVGSTQDSFQTPLGAHAIAQKIGEHCLENEILSGREAAGECADIISQAEASDQDLILSRILWLRGLEAEKNLGSNVDSYQRYIYIHGTQEEGLIGTPASHGCVRMLNKDVIELFDRISEGAFVYIA